MRAREQDEQSQNNAVCDTAAKSFSLFLLCKNVDSFALFSIEKLKNYQGFAFHFRMFFGEICIAYEHVTH